MQVPEDFNEMLHWLRSRELIKTQPVPHTMVSVGCSDLGYFNWIGDNLGWPKRHIGLEFYRPKPEHLPRSVQWIANAAGNMCDVESENVDLVFACQTVEHLWFEELAGFFTESARVLKPGGRLVFDNPNRRVTTKGRWNHPEHTIELIHEEVVELCRLSGFDVVRCVGHCLCLDGDELLPITEINGHSEWTADRRIAAGEDRSQASFSWWIEAKRNTQRCDVVSVYNYARSLSQNLFENRVNCLMQSRVPAGDAAGGGATYPYGFLRRNLVWNSDCIVMVQLRCGLQCRLNFIVVESLRISIEPDGSRVCMRHLYVIMVKKLNLWNA